MLLVFDVVLDGEVKETITPINQRLINVYTYVNAQLAVMKRKYGNGITVSRRIVYK